MRRTIGFIVLGCVISGCATVVGGPGEGRQLVNPAAAHLGMSRQEVLGALGDHLTIGYEFDKAAPSQAKPITFKNPYRRETIAAGDKSYDVDYYFTSVKKPDDAISDDELVPFVFENDKLIGQGWEFLNQLKVKSRTSL